MESFLLALGLINAVGLCVVALLLLAVIRRLSEVGTGAGSFELPPDIRRIADGQRLPDLAGVSGRGDSLSGRDIEGPALISILSSTCSSCVERARELATAAKAQPGLKFVVLLSESESDTAQLECNLDDDVLILRYGDSEEFHDRYLVDATPFHYVLDQQGQVVKASIELEPALTVLKSQPVDEPSTR